MPQLHFYVPEAAAQALRAKAKAAGLPVSRYIAKLVQSKTPMGWPPGYFEKTYGSWEGKPLRRPRQLKLEEREPM